MEYVELHCHSNFSFLTGASHPEQLITRAAELGYKRLALTDRDGFYGIVRFNKAAHRYGINPIFGAQLTHNRRLILLATSAVGYANLSQLISTAGLQNPKGEARVTTEMLDRYSDGLILLLRDGLADQLLRRDTAAAKRTVDEYREVFGRDNVFLEMIHHNLPVHETLCEHVSSFGKRFNIPVVATNDVHYALPDNRRLQDVLTCIRNHTNLDDAGQLLYPNGERYLKSPDDMIRQFAVYPDAIANTVAIAERCQFILDRLETSLPDFHTPDGSSVDDYLRRLTYEGARDRYGDIGPRERAQIEHELQIIGKLQLAGYFLIVWDIARFCREQGILAQGRGSAANSAVCYCLGVTAVDPVGLELLFERFVSEERSEPPDIDIDIGHQRREEVIQYVYEKYGREHAAMVCEIITYRGRSSIRDVGKALGFSLDEVDRLAKQLDHYSHSEEVEERAGELNLNLENRRVRLLIELSRQIQRFPRHLGIHVGGMIITKRPLSRIVPIENATMPDRSVIQWDKDDAEDMRMVKIDLLGLGMLSLIDIAFKLLKEHRHVTIDPAKLTYDDPKVYQLLSSAETVGVFQVESRAQMNTLPRHKPERFYDLVVEVALIRPGPIQGDMVHPYLRRRNGEEDVTYPHPCLEPILKRTLGVPLFQEQGMRVAMTAAGFSPSEADELRRAMGHKRSHERMEDLSARLIAGMVRKGISEAAAERIYHQLAAFADFGFAESHAASFALLVYVSAYLKVYYPPEFYCALLNAQPLGFYTPSTIVYEAKRRGVTFLGVDARRSRWDCTIEDDKVRLGFRVVKHLGDAAKERLEAAQDEKPFASIEDFVNRAGVDPRGLEQMALSGAFGCYGVDRRRALWAVLALLNRQRLTLPLRTDEHGHRHLPSMHTGEKIVADFKGMGLSNGPHPMRLLRIGLTEQGILAASDLNAVPNGRGIKIGGMVVIRQRPMTAKGFMFITMEDETGFANIVVKPNLLKRFRKTVVYCNALLVKGVVEKTDVITNVIGYYFEPLPTARTDGLKAPLQTELGLKSRDFR